MTLQPFEALELQARGGFPLHPFIPRRFHPGNRSSWAGHLAFANDLMLTLKPGKLVELGTHFGESYFTFCQAIQENALPTLCYAVDTWQGEEHAGFYGEEVHQEVSEYNQNHYKSFSYLLRTTFDEAVISFADESIDLLHIDGLHTYDAVRHDFETWLPKVRAGGVILLHDIAVRHADFGVWRLWEEIEKDFAETFAFYQWWGLGVVRKPGGKAEPSFLDVCFHGSPEAREGLRRHYAIYATYLEHILTRPNSVQAMCEQASEPSPVPVQVFQPTSGSYVEENSTIQLVQLDTWNVLRFGGITHVPGTRVRLDPGNRMSLVKISSIRVLDSMEEILWQAEKPDELRGLELVNDLVALPAADGLALLSYGNDPILLLPELQAKDAEVAIEIRLRIEPGLETVSEVLGKLVGDVKAERSRATQALTELQAELTAEQSKRARQAADAARILSEQDQLRAQIAGERDELLRVREQASALSQIQDQQAAEIESLKAAHSREKAVNQAIMQSRSWRLTAPLRKLMPRASQGS